MSSALRYNRFWKIELAYFLIYFYVFRILTDIEYNFWEKNSKGISWVDVQYILSFGTAAMLAAWVLYKSLWYCVNKKSTGWFVLTVFLFLMAYHFYLKGSYWVFSQMPFLSEEVRSHSLRLFKSNSLAYSIAYVMREILTICALVYFRYSLQQKELLRQLKEEKLSSELNYLKAQLQPHFFFNTLNNIYGQALNGSPDTAPTVAKLAEIMRYILYQSQQDKVPLVKEIEFLESYVDIEKIRHYQHVQIQFHVQNNHPDVQIAPLLLLPFVENAFKHGTGNAIGSAFVHITLHNSEESLNFRVKNSKPGAKPADKQSGIGLVNTRKRLSLLYPQQHELTITDENDYFDINLLIKWKLQPAL